MKFNKNRSNKIVFMLLKIFKNIKKKKIRNCLTIAFQYNKKYILK